MPDRAALDLLKEEEERERQQKLKEQRRLEKKKARAAAKQSAQSANDQGKPAPTAEPEPKPEPKKTSSVTEQSVSASRAESKKSSIASSTPVLGHASVKPNAAPKKELKVTPDLLDFQEKLRLQAENSAFSGPPPLPARSVPQKSTAASKKPATQQAPANVPKVQASSSAASSASRTSNAKSAASTTTPSADPAQNKANASSTSAVHSMQVLAEKLAAEVRLFPPSHSSSKFNCVEWLALHCV